jgi:DNA-3-methyladenine glycosylase II
MEATTTRQQIRLALTPTAPYDFALALSYLRSSPSAVLERIREDGIYERALRLDGAPALMRAWSEGTIEAPRIALEIRGDALTMAHASTAERFVRRTFRLDTEPVAFYALGARDAVLGRLLARFPGVRPVLIAEPYEALMWAIIGQQINVSFARKLKLALITLAGETMQAGGERYSLLPLPAQVAALSEEALRAAQFSRQKAAYVLELSRAVAEADLRLDALGTLPHEEALARLTAYKGVGRWTAEYVLMRGFGAHDSIPAADLGLRAVIGRAYGLGRHATEEEVRARAERWAGWRGWAAYLWWLALQLKVEV